MAYDPKNSQHVEKYIKNHYDSVFIRVPKGRKRAVERLAASRGQSVNGLVNELLRAALGLSASAWSSDVQVNGDGEGAADDCKIR